MKAFVKFAAASSALFVGAVTPAFATGCGGVLGPCAVPEPGSLALVAVAIAGLALVARKSKK